MTKHVRFNTQLSLVAIAMTLAAGSAVAATSQASSSSTVVTPIAIAKSADLAFGSFSSGASLGTVTVSPNNSRAVGGGVTAMGGTATAAKFDVSGQANATYTISVVASTLTSGANSMTVDLVTDLSASAATTGTVSSGTLSGTGTQSIYVGGVLNVAANQAAGAYSGTVDATVNYN